MEIETWWKFLGGGAIAIAIIMALAKLLNAPPFKKNGNGHSLMDEVISIGRTLADNSIQQTELMRQSNEMLKIHGNKLDALTNNLGIAMERQNAAYKKLDNL